MSGNANIKLKNLEKITMKKILFTLAGVCLLCGSAFAQSKMVLVRGGTFLMGSSASERMRDKDEEQHSVAVDDFYCDAFEVRQSDYEKLMGENPSYNKGANLPVENVSFYDALEYCNKKSAAEGLAAVYKIDGKMVLVRRDLFESYLRKQYRKTGRGPGLEEKDESSK